MVSIHIFISHIQYLTCIMYFKYNLHFKCKLISLTLHEKCINNMNIKKGQNNTCVMHLIGWDFMIQQRHRLYFLSRLRFYLQCTSNIFQKWISPFTATGNNQWTFILNKEYICQLYLLSFITISTTYMCKNCCKLVNVFLKCKFVKKIEISFMVS